MKYSHKHHLSNENDNKVFRQPTNKEERTNISSLNSNKASGPSSIPYRILIILKNEISKQLADLFNLSFITGFFHRLSKLKKLFLCNIQN